MDDQTPQVASSSSNRIVYVLIGALVLIALILVAMTFINKDKEANSFAQVDVANATPEEKMPDDFPEGFPVDAEKIIHSTRAVRQEGKLVQADIVYLSDAPQENLAFSYREYFKAQGYEISELEFEGEARIEARKDDVTIYIAVGPDLSGGELKRVSVTLIKKS